MPRSRGARATSTNNPSAKTMATATGSGADSSGLSQTLQGHVDDIRSLLQCGICIRPLYEPFTLACGHTFCYSCLTSWFGGGRSNKTCPDCRAPVKTPPAPAYLVRAVVQMFTSRAELLEKGETTAEHEKHQHEEAERVENDRKNIHPKDGGLFRGTFNKRPPLFSQPIFDLEDNVVRCPHCSWELEEDSACSRCGYRHQSPSVTGTSESGWSDSEENSEMTDYFDDELEDGFAEVDNFDWNAMYRGGPPHEFPVAFHDHIFGLQRHNTHHPVPFSTESPGPHTALYDWQSRDSASSGQDDSELDELDDAEMDSFIDDEELDEGEYDSESDRSTVVDGPRPNPQPNPPFTGQLNFSFTITDMARAAFPDSNSGNFLTHGHHADEDSDSSDDDDDEGDDNEDGEDSEDDEDDDEDDEPIRPASGVRRQRMPPFNPSPNSDPLGRQRPALNLRSFAASGPYHTNPSYHREAPRQQPHTAGSSVVNAISVEDDSDEGPVAPRRRNRGRGELRTS